MIRKQCACGCKEWFTTRRNRPQFKNRQHYLASPQYRAQTAKGAAAAVVARTKHRAARPMVLEGFGLLSARELAIYERGRHNGLVFGRRKGDEAGYRRGWREALGEDGDTRWTAKRRAA